MSEIVIDVELRPHRGFQQTRLGPLPVEHNQYEIYAGKPGERRQRIGYVGKQPNAPINFLRQPNGQEWPEVVKQAVRQAIANKLPGDDERREAQPPEQQPDEPDELIELEEDED